MTYGNDADGTTPGVDGTDDDGLTPEERRRVARDKARSLRASHKKKDRRNRWLIRGGIAVAVVAVVAIVSAVVVGSVPKPAPGPRNMQSDGIKIGQKFKVVTSPALAPEEKPTPSKDNAKDVIAVQVYLDYQCPICGDFEKANAAQLKTWVSSGAATLEIHPIAIFDRFSQGAKYSTRAANAAACVANYSPNSFFDFNALLFAHQPKENSAGLTDKQIVALAREAKPSELPAISDCITDESFKSWVNAATARATTGPIVDSNVKKVSGTPTVIVNGLKYTGSLSKASDFAAAIVKAAGDTFVEDPTPTPTPTESTPPAP